MHSHKIPPNPTEVSDSQLNIDTLLRNPGVGGVNLILAGKFLIR